MRIVYPFTEEGYTPESWESLVDEGNRIEAVNVGGSDSVYGELLVELWEKGETFLVVEHDIILPAGIVAEYKACDEEWCSSPYAYFDMPVTTSGGGLGCTKFSSGLMARWPTMMRRAMEIPYTGHAPWHWCGCDWRTYTALRAGGLGASEWPAERHQTHTEVKHRAGKCSHGCRDEL